MDSAATVSTPSFNAVGVACAAICSPTTASHRPNTAPSETRDDHPRRFAKSPAALPNNCGSRASGPGPDHVRRPPATRRRCSGERPPRPMSFPCCLAAPRASSKTRRTKSMPFTPARCSGGQASSSLMCHRLSSRGAFLHLNGNRARRQFLRNVVRDRRRHQNLLGICGHRGQGPSPGTVELGENVIKH
ncbi:Uncharacterised protein [Mycobacteroides abscessus subsp. abscessus]|nr:Uncharacterised protein [Mycobacteroides abscessus subsp. abscessus]